jgi:hypothetical protein
VSNDILDELSRYDDDYSPSVGFLPELKVIPDGSYDFQILSAELTRTQKERKLVFRRELKVLSGPPRGLVIGHVSFFTQQLSVNILGGELVALGLDADRWTKAFGKAFSTELVNNLGKLKGVRFRGDKDTKDGYANLRVLCRLSAGQAVPPGSPASTPAPQPVLANHSAQPPSPDDEDIPF